MSYEKIISKTNVFDDLIKKSIATRLNEIFENVVWTSKCIIWCWCCDLSFILFQLRFKVMLLYFIIRQSFMRLKKCEVFNFLIDWEIRIEMSLEYRVWKSKILRWNHIVIDWIRESSVVTI